MSRAPAVPNTRHKREPSHASDEQTSGAYRAAIAPGGYLWPELRVGRQADYENAYDWDYFLNEFSSINKRRGRAEPLGGVACHYITDREMRDMILSKYEGASKDRTQARNTYRNIKRNLTSFICSRQVEQSYKINPKELNEHPELLGRAESSDHRRFAKSPDFQGTAVSIRDTDSGGVVGYDGRKLGLDLADNTFLKDERREVLSYLRREEGLDINKTRADWSPHATIFIVHDYLRPESVLVKWPDKTPPTMDFGPVRATGEI